MNQKDIQSACECTPTQRASLHPEDIRHWLLERHTLLQSGIQACRQGLFLEGLIATDFYHAKAKDVAFAPDETKILPRVRWDPRSQSPVFHWNRLIRKVFPLTSATPLPAKGSGSYIGRVKLKGRQGSQRMKVVLSAKHIAIQKATNGIAPSTFDTEPAWAQIAGEAAEKKLRALRKQAKLLTEISRRLSVPQTRIQGSPLSQEYEKYEML